MDRSKIISAALALGIDPATLPELDSSRGNAGEVTGPGTDWLERDLSVEEAEAIRSLLPPEPHQEGSISNITVLNGLLWAQRTGRKLTCLPACYGNSDAVRKRAERWSVAGTWDRVLSELDALKLSAQTHSAVRKLALAYARRGLRIRNVRAHQQL